MVLERSLRNVGTGRLSRRAFAVGTGLAATIGLGRIAVTQEATPAVQPFRVAFVYIGPVDDLGYTYAHDQGRIALQEALPNVETAFAENVPDTLAESEAAILAFAEDGYDLIVATSVGYGPAVLAVAERFPEIQFIHIAGDQVAANVSTGFGKIEEPQYVSGFVAASVAETGSLGYVAAFPIPEVIRGVNAFTLGAQAANPDATVAVAWTNTWFDPPVETAAAESLLDRGAEVIATNQDSPAPLQAAEGAGRFAIGYNVDASNLAPEAVLTSAIWDWGVYYIEAVEQMLAGTWSSTRYWGSWAEGVVDLAPLSSLVPADVAAEAEAVAGEFRSGRMGIADIFTGPLTRQDGSTAVAEGVSMTDDEILAMDWFVAGIEGSATGDGDATPVDTA